MAHCNNHYPVRLILSIVLFLGAGGGNALEYGIFGDAILQETEPEIRKDTPLNVKLSLFLAEQFQEDFTGLVEATLTDMLDGPSLEFERYWLAYEFSKPFKLSVGRFHRPLGYWNRTYHHGTLLHDTIERPFFLEFHESINATLSMHVTGVLATGAWDMEQGNLGYELVVGNATGLDTTQLAQPGRHDHGRVEELQVDTLDAGNSVGLRLTFAPWSNHYHFGVFGMHQDILEEGDAAAGALGSYGKSMMEQSVIGADFRYGNSSIEIIGEYFHYIHHDEPGVDGDPAADAFYLQLAYHPEADWTTAYRYSSLNTEQRDLYFKVLEVEQQYRHQFTLRHDINEFHSIKAELEYVQSPVAAIDSTASLMIQWSFLIR